TGDGNSLDSFFKDVLFPAYSRKKIKAGAFRLYKVKEGEKEQRHVVFVYPDIKTFHQVKKSIWDDREFRQKAQAFYDTTAPAPVYSEFVSYLSEAFDKIPVHRKPDPSRTLFEIRIYHSPNEEANQRKVKMFNKDEIDLFDKVAINSVLYGEILSGPDMPALLYLTWYKDEKTRGEAWEQFRNHPDWKRMSALPEYAHTATNNQSIFLSPMPYSQL
ncbi:MAG: NIPSNAP family protein, partial [Tannerella sp.]|nr:NIPSNAP family protein [Tannerella sp.]